MRSGTLLLSLALLAGCESAPKMPDAPKADPGMSKPAMPAAPAVAKPAAPSTPAAPSAPAVAKPVVPSTPSAPSAPSAPAAPAAPVAVPKAEAKAVTADLSKYKGPAESAELFGYDDGNSRVFFYTAGSVEFPLKVAADGAYEIAIKVSCDEAKGEKAKFTVAVDGQKVGGEVTCTAVDEKEYVVKAEVKAGDRKIAIAFLNDLYKENEYDLNMYVSGLTLRPAK